MPSPCAQWQQLHVVVMNLLSLANGLVSKEPVWKYFNFELDESGTPVDPNRIVCYLCAPHKTQSKTSVNLKQHLQSKKDIQCMESADIVRSEEQKKNPKQSSIKDFTQCSPGSLAPRVRLGK